MSTVTGEILNNALPDFPEYRERPWIITEALSIISGSIVLFIGLMRWGWIVDLIPLVSLAAFMTGSALSIAIGQVPTMMGISSRLNTRDAAYLVVINTLRNLGYSTVDAAMGLTALFLLYLLRYACNTLARRHPNRQKLFFFLATLRTAFVILLYTMISWLVNRTHREDPSFRILEDVPRGKKQSAVGLVAWVFFKPTDSWQGSLTRPYPLSPRVLSAPLHHGSQCV